MKTEKEEKEQEQKLAGQKLGQHNKTAQIVCC